MPERHCRLVASPSMRMYAERVRLALVMRCGAYVDAAVAGLDDAWPDVDLTVLLIDAAHYATALNTLATWRARDPFANVLAVAQGLDTADLLGLLSAGVADFTTVPLEEDDLAARAQRALGIEPATADASQVPVSPIPGLVGCNPAFVREVERIPTIAACDANVLILGEPGTGKKTCAQALHDLSPRAGRPWVVLDCAAIPDDLIEHELFGRPERSRLFAAPHRGALVHEAAGGTLFLRGIESLSSSAQAKLLRFMQEQESQSATLSSGLRTYVRIIATSRQDLRKLAGQGVFNQHLYFRLSLLTLTLPSLRTRSDDLGLLAAHFLAIAARHWKRPVARLAPAALQRLLAYDWPGNVRELEYTIERAVLQADGTVLRANNLDLPGDEIHDAPAPRTESLWSRLVQQLT